MKISWLNRVSILLGEDSLRKKPRRPVTSTLGRQMPSLDISHISWLFMALAFSAGISPFVLAEHFRKKDLAKLLAVGVLTEAKILGYEWRGEGKGRYFAVIFEFSLIDEPSPISYSKSVGGKTRPIPGSLVSVHYNATFPMLSAIDTFGLSQSIESYPDSLRNGAWKAANA
jgi:hypothetical protein